MRTLAIACMVSIALAIGACSPDTRLPPNTISMTNDNFVNSSLTVNSGTTVTFSDPRDSGGSHRIATGRNGIFEPEAGAPVPLDRAEGIQMNPGDTGRYVFSTPGVYHIMCVVHPAMNLVITVK